MASSIRLLRQVSAVVREYRTQLKPAQTIHTSCVLYKKIPDTAGKSAPSKGSERDQLLGAAAEVAASMPGIEEEAFRDISNQLSALDDLVVERVASRTISVKPQPPKTPRRKSEKTKKQTADLQNIAETISSIDPQTVHVDAAELDKQNVSPISNKEQVHQVEDIKVGEVVSDIKTEDTQQAQPQDAEQTARPAVRSQSILSELEAERGYPMKSGRRKNAGGQRKSRDPSLPPPEFTRLSGSTLRKINFPDGSLTNDDLLDGVTGLNIFNPSKWSTENQGEPLPMIQSWVEERAQALKDAQPFPFNGFEEMIRWTEEGKLWKYPIDNEQGLDEEKNTPFYEHVFLDKHLSAFPESGSVRRFMELVIMGLSKNPHLSVKEKVAHIKWFEEYFRLKQSHVTAEPLLSDSASAL